MNILLFLTFLSFTFLRYALYFFFLFFFLQAPSLPRASHSTHSFFSFPTTLPGFPLSFFLLLPRLVLLHLVFFPRALSLLFFDTPLRPLRAGDICTLLVNEDKESVWLCLPVGLAVCVLSCVCVYVTVCTCLCGG